MALVSGTALTACSGPIAARGRTESGFNGGVFTPPIRLPELTLQRAAGGQFQLSEQRGRLSLFFFGYTTCPDVCPLTLAYVAQARRQVGRDVERLGSYFITVDPERDTPQRLLEYVANFDKAIEPLTGTDDELARAREAFGVVAQKRLVPGSAAGYLMDHTALIYLVDGDGMLRLAYPHGMKPEDIAADVKRLIDTGACAITEVPAC
jgi:protein SCO1/2